MSEKKLSSLTLRTPASTANCGPGFDSLSFALSLYNFFKIDFPPGPNNSFSPPSSLDWSIESSSMIQEVIDSFSSLTHLPTPFFTLETWGDIPLSRGLGSSAALRSASLFALNTYFNSPLSLLQQITLLSSLEHSADNTLASLIGGFSLIRLNQNNLSNSYKSHLNFPLTPNFGFAVVSPNKIVSTDSARKLLPSSLPFNEALQSANSLAFFVACLLSNQLPLLKDNLIDFFHQPYRKSLTPFFDESLSAGLDAGAYAGWLSGSGSSIVCLSPLESRLSISKAMQSIFSSHHIPSQIFQLSLDTQGIQIVSKLY